MVCIIEQEMRFMEIILKSGQLAAAIAAILRSAGAGEDEANLVALNLVQANLMGHDSHGIGVIPRYIESIREGGLVVDAHATIVLDTGVLLTADGNRGFGQVVGREATALAITRARQHGACVLGLANAHHLGRIGAWAEQAAAAGLVSVHFVNVISRAIVAPWGGRDARHGTNPFCVGIPRGDKEPVVLDFATSVIAQGKTRVAHNKGERLKPGIVIDDKGNPSTDPRYSVIEPFGAILPFGEYKGSGLAFVCEVLGGALAGGRTWHGKREGRKQIINGMLSIFIDPARLGTAANLSSELEAFADWFKASPPADYVEKIRIAGEPERETMAKRLASGIPVDTTSWEEILAAGEKVGVARADISRIAGI
jgi:uncharacterized oxidoreductase